MSALHVIIGILSVFTALGLACAIGVGRRRCSSADPLSHSFGGAPHLCADLRRRYSQDHLEEIARR